MTFGLWTILRGDRCGVRVVHANGYTAPAHSQALEIGMMVQHVDRQPWATEADKEAFRAAYASLGWRDPNAVDPEAVKAVRTALRAIEGGKKRAAGRP